MAKIIISMGKKFIPLAKKIFSMGKFFFSMGKLWFLAENWGFEAKKIPQPGDGRAAGSTECCLLSDG
jgi:hypothetical protein